MLSVIQSCDQICVSLQQIKAHLRLDHSEDDDYLIHLINVATTWVEEIIDSPLLDKTYLWQSSYLVNRMTVELPKQNVTAIKKVDKIKSSGLRQPIRYTEQEKYGRMMLVLDTAVSNFEIEFIAGFGNKPSSIPADIRQIIINHVAIHYDCRTGIDREDYLSLLRSLQPYRKMGLS